MAERGVCVINSIHHWDWQARQLALVAAGWWDASQPTRNWGQKASVAPYTFSSHNLGWCREREKIDWQEAPKFDCQPVADDFYFFVVPRQFLQAIGEWSENDS